mgnify:CR=1 FL=1|jgi:hypothetical protein
MTYLDPKIWGPHYWFFLHTLSLCYPKHPSTVNKKKYYDFIHNFHLFIPVEEISSDFSKLVNKYPVTPYLDNRESFIKWVHFIHNKINEKLEKPLISLDNFLIQYYQHYKPENYKQMEIIKWREKILFLFVLSILLYSCYRFYEF